MSRFWTIAIVMAIGSLILAMAAPRLYNEILNTVVDFLTYIRKGE